MKPLPPNLTQSPLAFVGRTREIGEMLGAIDDSPGAGSVFLISGAAGIGKTRLAAEVARAAEFSGRRVLWGRCREGMGIPACWPWIQVLRGLEGTETPAGAEGPSLAARLVEADSTADPSSTTGDLFWLMDTAVGLLKRCATSCPLLVVVDDLHWADQESLQFLDLLAAEVTDTPLVVLGTFREPEVYADPALRPILGRLARLARSIPLRGFSRSEVEEFLARRFGLALGPVAVSDLCELTGGNPWFIDELMRILLSEVPIGKRDQRPEHVAMPEGIRAAVRQRIEALPPEARDLLAVAAVMGRGIGLAELETVTGMSEQAVLTLLAQPSLAQIVVTDIMASGLLRFSPPIVGDALYDELDLAQRVQLHRRIGEVAPEAQFSTPRRAQSLLAAVAEAFSPPPPAPPTPPPPVETSGSVFRCEGEYWTISYAGRTARLKDAKGLRYLAQLLARPLVEVHVGDLPLVAAGLTRDAAAGTALDAGLTVCGLGDAGQLLDAQAKSAYRQRLTDLREARAEAQELNDADRAARIEEEIDAIAHELSASLGLRGRDRRAASAAERARVNVTRTIRAAIEKIGHALPNLGEHLSVSVRTGTFCCYSPDPAVRPAWRL
ncbi:MAG: hypothetical protein QOH66_699 [Actinomycetota bacterium]|nr:hypothetical protein [Actinomycetota bacterium]